MRTIRLIENQSEIGAGTRGSSLGIEALKVASWNRNDDFFNRYDSIAIKDQNQLLYEENDTPSAIRIEGIVKVYRETAKTVSDTLVKNNQFPLVLSADHSSAGGVIAGVKMAYPEKRIGVIWVDAHGDLHSPYTSPSGNVHGMPLATALGIDNLESKVKEVEEKTVLHWNELKNIGGISPKIRAEDIVFFGVRDTEEPEVQLMNRLGIKNFTVDECRKKGISLTVSQALEIVKDCDIIYLSFDVDSLDSEKVSVGTGTPVPHGFFPKEAEEIINGIIASGKLACFEMVEVNPTLDDQKNKMAETAFSILSNITINIEKQLINE